MGAGGPFPQSLDHGIDFVLITLYPGDNRTVRIVPHPSGDTETPGSIHGVPAKPHSLNATGYADDFSDHSEKRTSGLVLRLSFVVL
jgi:hypothetical protein